MFGPFASVSCELYAGSPERAAGLRVSVLADSRGRGAADHCGPFRRQPARAQGRGHEAGFRRQPAGLRLGPGPERAGVPLRAVPGGGHLHRAVGPRPAPQRAAGRGNAGVARGRGGRCAGSAGRPHPFRRRPDRPGLVLARPAARGRAGRPAGGPLQPPGRQLDPQGAAPGPGRAAPRPHRLRAAAVPRGQRAAPESAGGLCAVHPGAGAGTAVHRVRLVQHQPHRRVRAAPAALAARGGLAGRGEFPYHGAAGPDPEAAASIRKPCRSSWERRTIACCFRWSMPRPR